jgi:hypothetical protein
VKRLEWIITVVAVLIIGSIGIQAYWDRDLYIFFSNIARIKVGDSKDQVITKLGNPAREQQTIPIFLNTREYTYCRKLKESGYAETREGRTEYEASCKNVAYGRSSATEVPQVLVWSKRFFTHSITCFAGFDSEGKVVTTACEK